MKNNEKHCPFCAIIQREKEAIVVFEDDLSLAFLDRRPLFPGHCLLVPKQHVNTLMDIPVELLGPFFANVQLMAKVIEKGMEAGGVFVAINNRVSQSVAHVHVHIVPRNRGDGLKGFFWPRQKYCDAVHIKEVQQKLMWAVKEFKEVTGS